MGSVIRAVKWLQHTTIYWNQISKICDIPNSSKALRTSKMPARKPEEEKEVMAWVEAVMEEPLPKGDYEEVLKDGIVLCKLINKLSPGSVKKIKEKGPAFMLMENVQAFQAADLFEGRNIPQVTLCLYALARQTQKHPEYKGPSMGPKMATKNERNFTEEEIRKGRDAQVGLQAGQNKG